MSYYKIAGLIVKMDPLERTGTFARPYMIDYEGNADIEVFPDFGYIKEKYKNSTDAMCEYLASAKLFYDQLIAFDGMVLHSSAVVKDGGAYLFSAHSGTGKSTHTCLWRRVYGDDNVKILNDDKPALRLEDGVWYAYGTPWSGKTGQNLNLRYPLKGICFLERGEENKISIMRGMQRVTKIIGQTSRIRDRALKEKQLDLVLNLVEKVPVWQMSCNMDPEAARVSFAAMSGIWESEE